MRWAGKFRSQIQNSHAIWYCVFHIVEEYNRNWTAPALAAQPTAAQAQADGSQKSTRPTGIQEGGTDADEREAQGAACTTILLYIKEAAAAQRRIPPSD